MKASCDDEQDCCREVGYATRQEEVRTRRNGRPLSSAYPLQGHQYDRYQQAVQIEQADDAPGEIARRRACGRSGGRH